MEFMKELHMITIKFRSGEERSFKAVTTEIRDGTLILYTKYRSKLRWVPRFPVDKIEWAQLSNGSVLIGVDCKAEAVESGQETSICRAGSG
jgi:hypothetical protein